MTPLAHFIAQQFAPHTPHTRRKSGFAPYTPGDGSITDRIFTFLERGPATSRQIFAECGGGCYDSIRGRLSALVADGRLQQVRVDGQRGCVYRVVG